MHCSIVVQRLAANIVLQELVISHTVAVTKAIYVVGGNDDKHNMGTTKLRTFCHRCHWYSLARSSGRKLALFSNSVAVNVPLKSLGACTLTTAYDQAIFDR